MLFLTRLMLAIAVLISISAQARDYTTPTKKLSPNEYPSFIDDLNFTNMFTAIDRQLVRYNQKDLSGTILMGGVELPQTIMRDTLVEFRQLVVKFKKCLKENKIIRHICNQRFESELKQRFDVYAPDLQEGDDGFGNDKYAHFTAYYTPTLMGSRTKTETNKWAIYNRPERERLARSTREEIDFENRLEGKGYDIFYTSDLFELYLLHVEGGGKVRTTNADGTFTDYYISYDGTNRREWNFISRYMREKNYIQDWSIYSQRRFLAENPDKEREIYRTCPSYVYFKVTDHPPLGNDAVSLSDNRSIATDRFHYTFKGMLAFVKTKRLDPRADDFNQPAPGEDSFIDFSRFMLDQDTGGAIRGKARVDLYFGEDEYAERAAQHVNHRGELYWIVLRPQ